MLIQKLQPTEGAYGLGLSSASLVCSQLITISLLCNNIAGKIELDRDRGDRRFIPLINPLHRHPEFNLTAGTRPLIKKIKWLRLLRPATISMEAFYRLR
jgi:hypothetical protein